MVLECNPYGFSPSMYNQGDRNTTMIPMHRYKRIRGGILTSQGFQKLQTAQSQVEFQKNCGNPYSLEQMSDRTGLAVNTL